MIQTSKGYIFEIKKNLKTMQCGIDANGRPYPLYGVKEEFVVSFKGDLEKVSLTFGLDGAFNIMRPAFYDVNIGLTPLANILRQEAVQEDLIKFGKSNRATYSVCPTLICTVSGKINRKTGEWTDDTRCNFYVQRTQSLETIGGKQKDCVVCDLYSSVKGIHTFCSTDSDATKIEAFKKGLTNRVLGMITPYLETKETFWLARVNN